MTSLLQKIRSLPPQQQLELIQLIAKGLQERGQRKMDLKIEGKEVEIVLPVNTYLKDRTDTTI